MRHPQRALPKQNIHATLEKTLYRQISLLLSSGQTMFGSMSSLVETLVFWGEGIYFEQQGEKFLFELLTIKARHLLRLTDLHAFPPTHTAHLTMDCEAIAFLDLLCEEYPVVFQNRTEALALLLAYASVYCTNNERRQYLLRRLNNVLIQHPPRVV